MITPAMKKAVELCADYNPQFNIQAVNDLILAAWKMGFDVVKAPEGSTLYEDHCRWIQQNLQSIPVDWSGYANALANKT